MARERSKKSTRMVRRVDRPLRAANATLPRGAQMLIAGIAGRRLRVAGLWTIAVGLILGISSIGAAATWLSFGIWSDTEPMVVTVFAAAAIVALGLAISLVAGRSALAALSQPTSLVAFALFCLSLVSACFSAFPVPALVGAPQTGQGAFWWLAFAVFFGGARVLQPTRLFRWLALTVAATATSVCAINLIARNGWTGSDLLRPWVGSGLMNFDEFEAFYALVLLAFAVVAFPRNRFWAVAFVMLATAVLLASHNRTALIALGLAVVLLIPVFRRTLDLIATRRLLLLAAIALTALAPLILAAAVDLSTIAPTLWSRGQLVRIILPALGESWHSVLLGHGYGQYGELLTRDLDLRMLPLSTSGVEWGATLRDMFHSHNEAAEAFLALGIAGFVLRIALPVAAVWQASPPKRPATLAIMLAATLMDASWFTLPALIAPLASAYVAFSARPRMVWRTTWRPIMAGAAMLVAATTLATSAALLARDGLAWSAFAACLPPRAEDVSCAGRRLPPDLRGDHAALATLINISTGPAIGASLQLPDIQRQAMRHMFETAISEETNHPTAVLGMALAQAMAQIAWSDHGNALLPNGMTLETAWPLSLEALLRHAPARIDAAVPYLNWLVETHRTEALAAELERLRQLAPNNPVTLWFSGLAELATPQETSQRAGLLLMRQALANGIEHYQPIDPAIKRRLTQGH